MIEAIEPDNDQLLDALRAGDPHAQRQWVEQVGPRMLRTARGILVQEEDARDAVQEAFLSAFRGLATFDGRSRLSTWLHRITINASLMKLRSRRRRPERSIEELLPTYLADGHQTRSTPAWPALGTRTHDGTNALAPELAALIRQRTSELPENYRTMLLLRDIEQLSTEEAAAVLEITPAAAKVRLHRARQALRALIEPAVLGQEQRP